jgi:hypothetical protein
MVSRVACVETSCAESFGFSENPGQGAPRTLGSSRDQKGLKTPFIRVQERAHAKALFLTAEKLPTALATTISTTVSKHSSKAAITTDEPRPVPTSGKAGRLMSLEDKARVKQAIAKANSIEEVRRLERSLREGYLPEIEDVGA